MLRLRTFGGLELTGNGQPLGPAAHQKKPLALLAALAGAGDHGLSRDKLSLLFWPDSGATQAGNLLRQRLFHLRRDLGEPDVIIGTVQLRLNPAVIVSDASDFMAAIGREDFACAASVYTGIFLDGFHLTEALEFERWMDEHRAHFGTLAAAAFTQLARSAASNGKTVDEIAFRQRLAVVDPLDSRNAVALMDALTAAGDPVAALRHGKSYETRIRLELGVAPAPEITQLLSRLRTQLSTNGDAQPDAAHVRAALTTPELEGALTIETIPRSRDAWTTARKHRAIGLLAFAGAGVLALAYATMKTPAAEAPLSTSLIAVFPFTVRGSSDYQYLKEGIPDLLNTRLNGAGRLRTVDLQSLANSADSSSQLDAAKASATAKRIGAGVYVLGSVVESGRDVQLIANVHNTDGSVAARLEAHGETSQLGMIVDRLASQILATLHKGPAERLAQSATTMTASFSALKEYLIGEQEYRAGRYGASAEAFQRAVRHDSTFALAYYRLAVAAESAPWSEHGTDSAASRAVHFASRLPVREQELFAAFLARRKGDFDEAQRRYRIVVGLYPDEVEAWFQLAEIQFHYDPLRGQPLEAAKPSYERVLRYRPNDGGALTHLLRLAASLDDRRAVDTLSRKLMALRPAETSAPPFVVFRAVSLRDSAALERGMRELAGIADEFVTVTMRHVAHYARDIPTAIRIGNLLTDRQRATWYRMVGYHSLATFFAAQGKPAAADIALREHDSFQPDWSLELRGFLYALPFLHRTPQAIDSIDRALAERRAIRPMRVVDQALVSGWDPRIAIFARGLLAVRSGKLDSAGAFAIQLEKSTGSRVDSAFLPVLANTIRAEIARSQGDLVAAIGLLGDERPVGNLGALGWIIGNHGYQRYLRAELLREQGKFTEALRWYETMVQSSVHEVIFLAPSHLRRAQIYDRLGNKENAARHYRHFADIWSQAEPPLKPLVDAARQRAFMLEKR